MEFEIPSINFHGIPTYAVRTLRIMEVSSSKLNSYKITSVHNFVVTQEPKLLQFMALAEGLQRSLICLIRLFMQMAQAATCIIYFNSCSFSFFYENLYV